MEVTPEDTEAPRGRDGGKEEEGGARAHPKFCGFVTFKIDLYL